MDGKNAGRLPVKPVSAADYLMALARQWGGAPALVAAYALLHVLLLQLGYALKVSIADPSVIWPSAGLALATLWMLPRRLWPAILAVQFVVEVGTAALWMDSFRFGPVSLYTLANMAGALTGASLARWRIRDMVFLRARQVLWFVVVTAVAAAVSASIALPVHLMMLGEAATGVSRLVMWQLWAAGQWAGIIIAAPLLASWLSPLRNQYPELRLRSGIEVMLMAVLLVGACFYVSVPTASGNSLLQLPTTLVLLVIVTVMRLPPRWVLALVALTAVTLAGITVVDAGPAAEMSVAGLGRLQFFLVTLGLLAFVLSVTLAERSITARRLRESEYRYRNFVELSTEAMWRIELAQPMPLDLSLPAQLAWLREHACIAEVSRSYDRLDARATEAGPLPWDPSVRWMAAFETQFASAAAGKFTLDGLRFDLQASDHHHAFVASFNGVVQRGRLLRIWGVARDITELVDLNASLMRERERLKSYARQIVTAEEKARRATAVDLHDGIGQSLAGMAMTLDVARQHASADVKLLVEEVRARLFEVQERTRSMISDLSPPGLYDLGLKAALQWLAVYVRSQDQLRVELDVELREEVVPLETRVLVFKLVRELLRNVVKHAGVSAARLKVRGDAQRLHVHVGDEGRGFEWQLDMFGTRNGGFGLWSIADRVSEVGGELAVDTAPGRGARFDLVIPLQEGGAVPDGRPAATPIKPAG